MPADYVRAVSAAGGAPIMVPPGSSLPETLDVGRRARVLGRLGSRSGAVRRGGAPGDERRDPRAGRLRAGADACGAGAGRADARDLPRFAGVERRARRRPRAARAGPRRDGAASRGSGRVLRARRRGRRRNAAGVDPGRPARREVASSPGLRRSRRRACAKRRAPRTERWRRWRTRRAASPWASCGIQRPARTAPCSRRWSQRPWRSAASPSAVAKRRSRKCDVSSTAGVDAASPAYPLRIPRRPPIDPDGTTTSARAGLTVEPSSTPIGEHECFLRMYTRVARKYRWETLAWALMQNHHHLVIRLTEGGLSEGMRELHGGYSRWIHAMYGQTRKGHLFRHAFFARQIADDADLLTTCAYVDLNPSINRPSAGRCALPTGVVTQRRSARAHPSRSTNRVALLELFDDRPVVAQRRYQSHVEQEHARRRPDPSPNHDASTTWLDRARDCHRHQPGDRGDDRDARVGWGRRDRRGGCCAPGARFPLGGRSPRGPGAAPAAARDARRRAPRGALADRVRERRQADQRAPAARSGWSPTSSTSTPARSTSATARRSPSPAAST